VQHLQGPQPGAIRRQTRSEAGKEEGACQEEITDCLERQQ